MVFDDLKHAQKERLAFLDHCLTWRGKANRRDLVERFGISAAQAALDFRLYLERAGENAPHYDAARKAYLAAGSHEPVIETNPENVFDVLSGPGGVSGEVVSQPERKADSAILARLYQAIETQQALHLRYVSMASGASDAQWIAPIRFVFDGETVYVRAYSFKHTEYRYYLPIRINPDSAFKERPAEIPYDQDWHTRATVWLRPRADLSREQAAVVRREYGFKGRYLKVETRKAMEFFFDRRWRIGETGARLERTKTVYKLEKSDVKNGGKR